MWSGSVGSVLSNKPIKEKAVVINMILCLVYCLGTDGVNTLVTGTARHGRVRSVVPGTRVPYLSSIDIYIL
jgi:hypothetical protein